MPEVSARLEIWREKHEYRHLPKKGAVALQKKKRLDCVGVAECGGCGVWGLQSVRVVEWGGC